MQSKALALQMLDDWRYPAALVVLVLVVGLLAGSYPAFYLSAFKPVQVLKNSMVAGGATTLRSALVVLQFSIAIVLVVSTLIVMMQMRFARNIELGFEKDQILVLTGSPTAGLGQQWDTMRQQLLSIPGVESVTASGQTPLEDNGNARGIIVEGEDRTRSLPSMQIDYDFFSTYEVPMLAGREFTELYPGDWVLLGGDENAQTQDYGVILNELAARQLGWTPEEAVGKRVRGFADAEEEEGGHIVGVVSNTYFESIRTPLKPLLFYMPPRFENGMARLSEASIRLSPDNVQQTLSQIDAI